tara:strand:- start:1919 stop:2509 length:591 start_codon:yes stop_codon:yes gene_type:complete
MSRQMLIIGSKGGVGEKCVDYFSSMYDVIPISREQGDLRDKEFLQTLVDEYNPSVVLNCIGVYEKEFFETFESNFLSVSFLTMEFYKKMESGHIINICSSSANSSGWPGIDYDRLTYNVSKSSLKKFSNMLQSSKNRQVKVTTLEPAQINTKMLKHKSDKVTPLEPSYIVDVIHWILNQPQSVVISSIEIQNDSRL